MDKEQVLDEFRAAGALLEGHFRFDLGPAQRGLSAMRPRDDGCGARSPTVCEYPARKRSLHLPVAGTVDLVVSPAMGGVVVGYEMGRQIGRAGNLF